MVFISFCASQDCGSAHHHPVHRQSPGVWSEASDPKLVQTLASEQGVNSGADQSQVSAPKTGAATGGSLMVCLSCARRVLLLPEVVTQFLFQ